MMISLLLLAYAKFDTIENLEEGKKARKQAVRK